MTLTAISDLAETSTPITGTFANSGAALSGYVSVIVSGHGSSMGGDEYMNTQDTLGVNGQQVGSFSTEMDCAPYAALSPDGNPGIFQGNTTYNPRNWCPGAGVTVHRFAVTLGSGSNTVTLDINPSQVPSGSNYVTSINFTAP